MTADEVLSDPCAALDLDAGCVPLHVVLIVEYAEPGSDDAPGRNRMASVTDDAMPPWLSIGLLRFAQQLELDEVKNHRMGNEGEEGD